MFFNIFMLRKSQFNFSCFEIFSKFSFYNVDKLVSSLHPLLKNPRSKVDRHDPSAHYGDIILSIGFADQNNRSCRLNSDVLCAVACMVDSIQTASEYKRQLRWLWSKREITSIIIESLRRFEKKLGKNE